MFTVTLPKYNYVESYDRAEFTSLFPNSLITLALQSGENDIPLENSLVTPDILQALSYITTRREYPILIIRMPREH